MPTTPDYGLLTGDQAAQRGLGQAYGLMSNYSYPTYPNFTPSQSTGPSQSNYYNYTPNQPMAQVQTPNYKMNAAAPTWQSTDLSSQNINSQDAQAAGYQFQNYGASAPAYQRLSNGDYDALQQSLTQPGQIAAQNAYQTGNRNLNNAMGGRGLYGSSIMATQANEGINREYMNALATNAANAATQRYGMQQTDLANASGQDLAAWQARMGESLAGNSANLDYAKLATGVNQGNAANNLAAQQSNQAANMDLQGLLAQQGLAQNTFASNNYGIGVGQEQNMNQFGLDAAKLGVTQNQNTWQANQTMNDQQNAYNLSAMQYGNQGNEASRQWNNQQELEKYQYDLARQAYQNQQQEAMVNQYLALAGQGAPLSAANTNYQQAMQQIAAQQEIAAQQGTGQLLGGLLNLTGTLGSGVNYSNGNWSYGTP